MGEYAKCNGEEIKIGTCEMMYYLRYEDRMKVRPITGGLDPAKTSGLFYRLPFPDEDLIGPGNYDKYDRGLRLFRLNDSRQVEDFADETTMQEPGLLQLRHTESGLLLNVACYHGLRLPTQNPDIKPFWNGKGHSFELMHVKEQPGYGPMPVVGCRHCGKIWRYDWDDVLPYVHDPRMRKRLEAYK